jgi:hypothetical protein
MRSATSLRFGLIAAFVLGSALSASAYTYSENFETDIAGWGGNGGPDDFWLATGGVGDSGFMGGRRTGGYFPYLAPVASPATDALWGDMGARFGNLIRFSYHAKVLSGGPPRLLNFYVFSPNSNIWGLSLGNPELADWTKISFEINTNWTDEEARAAGWYNDPWGGGTFADCWKNVTYYNFLSGQGSGTCETGIDSVRVESIAQLAPANDNCASAEAVTGGGVAAWTTFATNDGDASCGSSGVSPDVWYSYTAPCDGLVNVKLAAPAYSAVLSIHTGGCPGDTTNEQACAAGAASLTVVTPATTGQEFLIRVSGSSGAVGNFAMSVSCGAPPGNDDCTAPEIIADGATVVSTTAFATNDGNSSCGDSSTSPDLWYSYTAPRDGILEASTCGSTFDTVVSIHTGCPGTAANELASGCNDNCDGSPCGGPASCARAAVASGGTYLIRVAGASGAAGSFFLKAVTKGSLPYLHTFGDLHDITLESDGGGAFDIGVGPAADGSRQALHIKQLMASTDQAIARILPNVIFPTGGLLTYRYRLYAEDKGVFGNDGPVYAYTGNANLGGVDGTYIFNDQMKVANNNATLVSPLKPNTWYTVGILFDPVWSRGDLYAKEGDGPLGSADLKEKSIWWNVGSGQPLASLSFFGGNGDGFYLADFSIEAGDTINPPPPNDDCVNATPVSNGETSGTTAGATPDGDASCSATGAQDVWYSYQATCTGWAALTIKHAGFSAVLSLHSACPGSGGAELACGTKFTAPVHSGETYLIRVAAAPGSNPPYGTFTFALDCSTPPPNDECSSALPLNDGDTAGQTVGATNDGDASCGGSGTSPDVWYLYTAPCSKFLNIKCTTASFDPVISVHDGAAGCPGDVTTELGCSQGVGPVLSVAVVQGSTYLVRVAGAGGAVGSFTLNAGCGDTPNPPEHLYCHNFSDLHDIVPDGRAVLQSVPAPGGKPGKAMWISNPTGGGGYATLTPSGVGVLPNGVTVLFRVYIDSRTNFMGVYNYPPGEGIRFLDGGGLQGSCGESLTGTWAEDTWYTVGLVLGDGAPYQAYIKQGADAVLTEADFAGNICGGARPTNHTVFFNYGGEAYYADYTINDGVNFTMCPTAPACNTPPQDVDGDGDVDLVDFLVFQGCFNGPNRPYASTDPMCKCLDTQPAPSGDTDVDLADFLVFQGCFNGPNRPPMCP